MFKISNSMTRIFLLGAIASLVACGGGGGTSKPPGSNASSAAPIASSQALSSSLPSVQSSSASSLSSAVPVESSLSSLHSSESSSRQSSRDQAPSSAPSSASSSEQVVIIPSSSSSSESPVSQSSASSDNNTESSLSSVLSSSVPSSSSVSSSVPSSVSSSLADVSSSSSGGISSSSLAEQSSSVSSVGQSSSSVEPSSSSEQGSSSTPALIGDPLSGQAYYKGTKPYNNGSYPLSCATCHGVDGSATQLTMGKRIDEIKDTYGEEKLSLSAYIAAKMPAANICTDSCAADVAAYIMNGFDAGLLVSSSSAPSSVASSSSVSSQSSSSSAPSINILFQESFEDVAINTQPAGWDNYISYNYNASNTTNGSNFALVDGSRSYSGSQSVLFRGDFAQIVRALPAGLDRVYLRAYVNLSQQMGGMTGDNHEHIMGIKKTPDDKSEIRVGQIKGTLGTNEYPSDNIAPQQAQWEKGKVLSPNTWYCIETSFVSHPVYDQLHMKVDGELVHSVTSVNDWQHSGSVGANWISDKLNYVMFGFQSYSGRRLDIWMDDIVVATEPVGCGDVSGGSSSQSSVVSSSSVPEVPSSSSSSVSSSVPSTTINLVAGKASFAGCAVCHGATGAGTGAGPKINPEKQVFTHSQLGGTETMESFIRKYMLATLQCTTTVDECVNNVSAYIRNGFSTEVRSSSSSVASSVGGNSSLSSSSASSISADGISYGPRSLRVLTRNEFANSVQDLTGVNIKAIDSSSFDTVPGDSLVGGFPNNTLTILSSSMMQSYSLVVGKVVDALAAQNFAGVVSCASMSVEECGAKLIAEFMPKVFRRPLTDDESRIYQTMFTPEYTGGDASEGIKLALKTMLTSPQFLYRDETGISAAEIANGASEPQYEAAGTAVEVFSTYPVKPSYHAGNNVPFSFTGTDLLDITAIGVKDGNGNWPTLNVTVGNKSFPILINANYAKQYKVLVSGVNGGQYMALVSSNGGCADCLILNSVKVSAAKKIEIFSPVVMDDDSFMLDQYQLASFLSFTYTGSTPDAALLSAAAEGKLQTGEQISTQVERLLATPKAKMHFGNFAAQWLRTDRILEVIKDTNVYPNFTNDVRQAMAQEVRELYTHVVLDEGEPFTSLFNGNFTIVNAALANFYGIPGVTGTHMRKVSNVNSRAGLVTAGAYLASYDHNLETAPILRAVGLRRQFLCHDVPAPPTGVSLTGDNVDELREKARVEWEAYLLAHNGKATSRLKYEFQTSAALCQTCHKEMINPLGGGMEDFDAVGLPQTTDYNQLTVNAIGALIGVNSLYDGQRIEFNGAKDLANKIAELDVTRQCFIDNHFRLAMGTSATYFDREKKSIVLSDAEKASYLREQKKLEDIMKANNNSTKAMLKALGSMDSVRYRKDVQR